MARHFEMRHVAPLHIIGRSVDYILISLCRIWFVQPHVQCIYCRFQIQCEQASSISVAISGLGASYRPGLPYGFMTQNRRI